ncbi:hypothetical protein OQJ02_09575 [Legionella sp. PATHC032]|uniref:hypothetical protein n=1 Tax=Legionella sp. PATHC032 TaxID=2992039 RepID=UPI001B1FCF8D|nr:hypothetical protein [Legionella sp. PATHC032]MCW8421879.1 hypothetical protein [Legionella sp. PATHC032]HAZ7572168.1 hypothetical protein [Legionella pneumophila]HBA1634808.1 hypothetical protein [Legionella pneumophila]
MKKTNSGFILLMTLCITFLMSLLVLASLQQVLLHYKALNTQETFHQNFYQLEHWMMRLARSPSLYAGKDCYKQKDYGANKIVNELVNNKGCLLILDRKKYRYFIEDLNEFSCLVLDKHGQKHASHHFRFTVLQYEKYREFSIMQLRFIKSGGNLFSCPEEELQVKEGVISWRYLPDYKNFKTLTG